MRVSAPCAIFHSDAPGRHFTQNDAYVAPLENIGIPVSNLNANQQTLVMEIIHKYLDTLPDLVAASHLERLQAAGFENITFAWAGPLRSAASALLPFAGSHLLDGT